METNFDLLICANKVNNVIPFWANKLTILPLLHFVLTESVYLIQCILAVIRSIFDLLAIVLFLYACIYSITELTGIFVCSENVLKLKCLWKLNSRCFCVHLSIIAPDLWLCYGAKGIRIFYALLHAFLSNRKRMFVKIKCLLRHYIVSAWAELW